MKKMGVGTSQGVKSLYEAVVTYPRTIKKDGYFCVSASVDPFPNWPLEKIYNHKWWKHG